MGDTTVYEVRAGDWMAKIAQEHGTTVSAIWNHPLNAQHRAKRQSPDVLYPGDVLNIPVAPELPVEPPPPPLEPPPPQVFPPQVVPPPAVKPAELPPWPYPPHKPGDITSGPS